jgi:hypothetical protein
MATGQGNFQAGEIQNIDIELDVNAVVAAIMRNPTAMAALVDAVRNQMLKDARQMGTLFRQWGSNK